MNKVFRVFLSSTFDDWTAEREHLRKEVFPGLRDDCEKKGGRLLPVDLRWGISEEAGKAHATVDICLDEVRRCCDVSPKPNFLIFLGNRYGWRPLPPKLSETQWKGLKALNVIKEENCLFQKWYKLDKNAKPHEYCLKPQPSDWKMGKEAILKVLTNAFVIARDEWPEESYKQAVLNDLKEVPKELTQKQWQKLEKLKMVNPDDMDDPFIKWYRGDQDKYTLKTMPSEWSADEKEMREAIDNAYGIINPEREELLQNLRGSTCKIRQTEPWNRILKKNILPDQLSAEDFEWCKILYRGIWGFENLPTLLDKFYKKENDEYVLKWFQVNTEWEKLFPLNKEKPWQDDTPWLVGSVVEQELLYVLKIHDERGLDKSHIHAFIREIDFSDVGLNKCLEKFSSYKCADNLTGVAREVDNMLPYIFTDQDNPIADYRLKKIKDDIEKWLDEDHVIRVNDTPYQWAKCDWKSNERPKRHNESFGEFVKSTLEGTIDDALGSTDNGSSVPRPNTGNYVDPESFKLNGEKREGNVLGTIQEVPTTPILLFGKAGSGKSTLLSKVVEELEEGKSTVYDLWIGLDEHCSTGEGLLRSIIERLPDGGEPKEELSGKSFYELKDVFHKLCKTKKDIWITVDALDQLPEGDPAKQLNWLPKQKNVHIIVSTLDAAIKDDFEKAHEKCSVLEIEGLDEGKAEKLLESWLDAENRKLTVEQQDALLETYNGTPLHLKLLFERAKLLKSFDPIPVWLKQGSRIGTDTSIKSLFDHLASKEKHGSELVARALSYIAATPYGVPEDVLLELLRADERLVGSFKGGKYWRETDEKIPEIVWSRLYHDLEPFLARRSFYGEEYLDFYHAEFRRVTLHKVDLWVDQEVMLSCRQNIESLANHKENFERPSKIASPELKLSLKRYLYRHGTANALEIDKASNAADRLTSFAYLMSRLELLLTHEVNAVGKEYFEIEKHLSPKAINELSIRDWELFIHRKLHLLNLADQNWPVNRILMQLGIETSSYIVSKSAKAWAKEQCDWDYLEAVWESSTENPCIIRTLECKGGIKQIIKESPEAFISQDDSGEVRVWNLNTFEFEEVSGQPNNRNKENEKDEFALIEVGYNPPRTREEDDDPFRHSFKGDSIQLTCFEQQSETFTFSHKDCGEIEGRVRLNKSELLIWAQGVNFTGGPIPFFKWHYETGKIELLEGHSDLISKVITISKDRFISFGWDNTIRLWTCLADNTVSKVVYTGSNTHKYQAAICGNYLIFGEGCYIKILDIHAAAEMDELGADKAETFAVDENNNRAAIYIESDNEPWLQVISLAEGKAGDRYVVDRFALDKLCFLKGDYLMANAGDNFYIWKIDKKLNLSLVSDNGEIKQEEFIVEKPRKYKVAESLESTCVENKLLVEKFISFEQDTQETKVVGLFPLEENVVLAVKSEGT